MRCELIAVGTEILLGDIVNTDAQFLARELANMGFSVCHQSVVGDNEERLAFELKAALSRSDVVITSGGLGPTPDDLTKEVSAKVMGVELVSHSPSVVRITEYFKNKGRQMPDSNLKQAMLPSEKDGVIFQNDNGTAPGCAFVKGNKVVINLPGPPRELKPMFFGGVVPFLQRYSDAVIVSSSVRLYGVGESFMAARVDDLLYGSNPTVAPYAKDGEALLRVTARAENEQEARKLIKPTVDEIVSRFGDAVYGVDCNSLQECVVELLKEKGMKIGLAESCTAGYIAKRITEISGSSQVFDCGIVSYANEVKEKLLGVPHGLIEQYGVVSPQVAKAMAQGALKVSGADIALGVTGIAGPDPSEGGKPAGLSYMALADKDNVWVQEFKTGKGGMENREYNRYVTASNALDMARRYLQGLEIKTIN